MTGGSRGRVTLGDGQDQNIGEKVRHGMNGNKDRRKAETERYQVTQGEGILMRGTLFNNKAGGDRFRMRQSLLVCP